MKLNPLLINRRMQTSSITEPYIGDCQLPEKASRSLTNDCNDKTGQGALTTIRFTHTGADKEAGTVSKYSKAKTGISMNV